MPNMKKGQVCQPPTYFIQTKYMRDWNDNVFFNQAGLTPLKQLSALGMEIGSHSVAHSRVFNTLPLGSGNERYPSYRPFVRNPPVSD